MTNNIANNGRCFTWWVAQQEGLSFENVPGSNRNDWRKRNAKVSTSGEPANKIMVCFITTFLEHAVMSFFLLFPRVVCLRRFIEPSSSKAIRQARPRPYVTPGESDSLFRRPSCPHSQFRQTNQFQSKILPFWVQFNVTKSRNTFVRVDQATLVWKERWLSLLGPLRSCDIRRTWSRVQTRSGLVIIPLYI